jgi:hypothetical protein
MANEKNHTDTAMTSTTVCFGEEDMPTIVLKPEHAIMTLDPMFIATKTTTCSATATCGARGPFDNGCVCCSHRSVLTASNVDSLSDTSSHTVLCGYQDGDEHAFNKPQKRRRAAYLSATVFKPSTTSKIGLGLKRVNNASYLQVSSVSTNPEYLLSGAPFQVGDYLVSINNIHCWGKRLSTVAKLLMKTTGTVTLVVENPGGDPQVVESMIMKASPISMTGLGLAHARGRRELKVSKINPEGLFADSLLSRGDTILAVNGVLCKYLKDGSEAAKLIIEARKNVSVVAEKGFDTAAVVALSA